jgi:eukaryotic-like serine/threonine-protein kinase
MPLAAGDRLGPYEVVALIGAGGMGEVYKGRDTRLDRSVAIKILKPGARERFEREARAISALNHANICGLYDIGTQGVSDFLVMEYMEGETLEQRLRKGPVPMEQAVAYGIEIASALSAAHRACIVHRDLKPANVMLVRAGVKLLDFGLAKPGITGIGDTTATIGITGEHVLIGTLHYMAPEQLEGKDADHRSDIFAFGLVLYEMLTGQQAFTGHNAASLIAAILTARVPSLVPKQPATPRELDHVIQRCLAKDRADRWQSAQDIVWELQWIRERLGQQRAEESLPGRQPWSKWRVATACLAVLLVAAAVSFFGLRRSEPQRVLSIVAPGDYSILESAISPDATRIAVAASDENGKRQLGIRPIDSAQIRFIPGTEGASDPFWSPDGQFIGFFARRTLKRISADADAATARVLADAPNARGGAWSRENVIVFAPNIEDGLYQVAATGGEVTRFTSLERTASENSHRWPQFLPDGRTVLFLARGSRPEKQGVYAATLAGDARKLILPTPYAAVYVKGKGKGSLLFADANVLMSRGFDVRRLQFTGDPKPVTNMIGIFDNRPHVSAAGDGTVVYQTRERPSGMLAWHDRSGNPVGAPLRNMSEPYLRVSRDERYAITHRVDPRTGSGDIWMLDLQRGTETRLTFHPAYEWVPVWSPDATHIAFGSNRNGPMDLYVKAVSGAEEERLVLGSENRKFPVDWSADGRMLVFQQESSGKQFGLYAVEPGRQSRPIMIVDSEFDEIQGRVSPDGRWLAYVSNETGAYEVYVRRFTAAGSSSAAAVRVSVDGGRHPQWRGDGGELYYLSPAYQVVSVPVKAGTGEVNVGRPTVLFSLGWRSRGAAGDLLRYAVSRDGKRFFFGRSPNDAAAFPLTILIGSSEW